MLEMGRQRVTELDEQPLLQIEFYEVLQKSYANLDLFDEALAMAESSLVVSRSAFGSPHEEIAEAMGRVADTYRYKGRFQEALQWYEEAIEMHRVLLPQGERSLAEILVKYMRILRMLYLPEQAFAAGEEALKYSQHLGDRKLQAYVLEQLGALNMKENHLNEAVSMLNRSVELYSLELPEDNLDRIRATIYLGHALIDSGEYDQAEPILVEMRDLLEQRFGDNHSELSRVLNAISQLHEEKGEYAEMEAVTRLILTGREKTFGENHPITGAAQVRLGLSLLLQKRYEEAEGHLLRGYEIRYAESPRMALRGLGHLVNLYEKTNDVESMNQYMNLIESIKKNEDRVSVQNERL